MTTMTYREAMRSALREAALLDDAERARIEAAVADTLNAAIAAAEAAPWEPVEDLLRFVTSEER